MKKTKVVHLVNSNAFSGLENVACDIIESTKDEFDSVYVTKNGPIVEVLKERKINFLIIEKVSIKEVKRIIKEIKPNIIHAHDYTASCICAMANISIPIISHLHNNSPWIKTLHPYSFLYLFSAKKFNQILTVSDSIEKEYIFSKYIKKMIKNIGNPVNRKKVLQNISTNKIEKKYDICCVARITKQKNPLKFIDIVHKLTERIPSLKVVWVGDGELKSECDNKIKQLKLENNIDFVGFKKNPHEYMVASRIFMLTSDWEGYGLVAFEALTLGIPCIVSEVGGLPNIVDNSCGKLCNNLDDYLEISNLLNDESLLKEMSVNAIKKSKLLDNSSEYFCEIKTIYKKIVEEL